MAKLQVRTAAVQPPPKEYVLTLSEAEARAVRLLVGAVVGNGAMRQRSSDVWSEMQNLLQAPDWQALGSFVSTDHMDRYVEGK